jgi:hypothetical protein
MHNRRPSSPVPNCEGPVAPSTGWDESPKPGPPARCLNSGSRSLPVEPDGATRRSEHNRRPSSPVPNCEGPVAPSTGWEESPKPAPPARCLNSASRSLPVEPDGATRRSDAQPSAVITGPQLRGTGGTLAWLGRVAAMKGDNVIGMDGGVGGGVDGRAS